MRLTEEALEARRAYKREWARKNKEKIKETDIRYWNRIAEKMKKQQPDSTTESENSE